MKQQHEDESSKSATQQPRNARPRISATKKKRPWYGRALDCLHLWMQPAVVPPPPPAVEEEEGSLRCGSSAKAAALALARLLCLCAQACSHEAAVLLLGVHVDAAVPTPMPRSCSVGGVSAQEEVPALTRPAVAQAWEATARSREPFMGRSLMDCALMRRFTLDEMAARRREEMEAVHVKRRRSREDWRPPGNSRLRRTSLAAHGEGRTVCGS